MKICFLSLNLFMHGGIQRIIPNIINGMTKEHEITIVMPYSNKDNNIFGLNNEIKIKNLNDFPRHNKYTLIGAFSLAVWKINKRIGILNNEIGADILLKTLYATKQKKGLIQYFNDNSFDIIIALTDYYSLLLAMIAPELKAKTIGWQHNTYESYFLMKNRNSYGQEVLFKKMMKNLNHLIVLTDADKVKYSESFGVETSTLYNPVSFDVYNKEPRKENPLIFVGRIYRYQKGIDYLIDIVDEIRKKKENVKIVLVGDGPDKKNLEENVEKRNLQDCIKFVGMSSDVTEYYKKASVFLHTSRYEGFGVVLVEAMAFGIPVVAFHNNGPDEIISNGKNGFLIEKYDITSFAEQVINLLEDDGLYRYISLNAKKRAEDFLPKKVTERFEEILTKVLLEEGVEMQ